MVMPVPTPLVVSALAFVGGVAIGIAVQTTREEAATARTLRAAMVEQQKQQARARTAAQGYERARAALAQRGASITKEVTRVVQTPFYAGPGVPQCLDADGLQQLRAAIGGSAPGRGAAGAVPGAD